MPPPEVSVVIPACGAEATIARAVASVLESPAPTAEIIIVADDAADYAAILRLSPAQAAQVRFLRTPAPRAGPPAARNLGAAAAQAPLLAFLDADDFYPKDRLARLAPLARERGAATGPCVAVAAEACGSTALPIEPGAVRALSLETIVTSRRSFSPVLRRESAPPWRPVRFAEDMIYNAELHGRAPDYAYDPAAAYGYAQTEASGSRGPGSLQRALRGYGDILAQLFEFELEDAARRLVFRQMVKDLDEFGEAHFSGGADGWREARGAV